MLRKLIIGLVLICFIGAGVAGTYVYYSLKPVSDTQKEMPFTVGKGDSLTVISLNLFNSGLIKSDFVFKWYGVIKEYDFMLKEGVYDISPSFGVQEIYDILILGKQELISVTIPEGYTSTKISDILERKGVVNSSDFLEAIRNKELLKIYNIPFDSAEGFLYPDTYSFQEDYPALLVVESFLKNFFNNLESIYPSYSKLNSRQLAEKVVLASIVEREYKSRSEIKTIASVFYNRLSKKMKLQSCATVMYVLTEEMGKEHRNRLFFEDLEIESKFNTYINTGLPPGAISNPGYYALDAVFHPEKSSYIYFVVKDRDKGLHSFSSKYSDHEEARLQYISGFESKR